MIRAATKLASGDRFSRHSVWSLVRHFVFLVSVALAYPLFFRRLGPDTYGIWAIASSIASYVQAADLGFGVALVHHVGADHVRGLQRSVWQRMSAGLIAFLAAGVLIIPALSLTLPAILKFAGVSGQALATTVWATRIMLLVTYFRVLGTLSASVLSGIGEMSVGYQWDAIGVAIGTSVMVVVTLGGGGLQGLVYSSFISPSILIIGTAIAIKQRVPLARMGDLIPHRQHLSELLSYGGQIQIASIATLAIHPISRLFVAKFGSLSTVAALDLAEKLVLGLRGIVVAILMPAIPAAARTHTLNKPGIRERYLIVRKGMSWGVTPLALVVAISCPVILRYWLGSNIDLDFATFTVRMYIAAYLPNMFLIFAYFTMQGAGYAAGPMYSQVAAAVVTAGAGVLLGSALGPRGVVLGVSAGVLTATGVTWLTFSRWDRVVSRAPSARRA